MPALGEMGESHNSLIDGAIGGNIRLYQAMSLRGQVLGRNVPHMNSRTIFHNLQIIGRVFNKKEQPAYGCGQAPGSGISTTLWPAAPYKILNHGKC